MNTRRLVVVAIAFFLSPLLYCQSHYKVLYTNGHVSVNDTLLKPGDLIKTSDKIIFTNEKGVLKVCFDNCSKTKVISELLFRKAESKTIPDYITYYEPLGSRGAGFINSIGLKNLLATRSVALMDTLKISIDLINIPLNETNFFYLRYEYLNEEINKKLKNDSNKVWITADLFIAEDNCSFNRRSLFLSLYHYNENQQKSTLIVPQFKISFLNAEAIRDAIIPLKKMDDKLITTEDKTEILKDYLSLEHPNTLIDQDVLRNLCNR